MSKFKKPLFVVLIAAIVLSYPLPALAGVFGVGVYLSSEPDADKTNIANSMSDLGISITRMNIEYNTSVDWAPYDTAVNLTRDRGIENLILLTYPGDRPSVDAWGDFVNAVASRYSGHTTGYEIFNEADNYISGSDYASYLWRSYDKIKSADSGAKVVAAGLTARSEATNFWQGIYDAGAWDKLDVLGLHPYRDDPPETVKYNIGDFITSINIAANFIRAKGGGKKIWLTEFGVKSSTAGDGNQANYLARSYIMSRAVSEVEKVMMYRYRDGDNWGMVRSDLSHKTLYDRYKNAVKPFDYNGTAERIYVYNKKTIDNFDSTGGWKTDQSERGSVSVSDGSGAYGGGMKYSYDFTSSSGYVVAEKEAALEGSPVGIGIWAKGPSTGSVLKLRVKDSQGETWQFDLGKVTNDWNFYKFDFSGDSAKTSWGGNGGIDYPIKFDSIIYDAQGGTWSGTLYLDELVAIYDAADLYAYKLGSKLAYWKVNGSNTTSACGKTLTFNEEPQIIDVESCSNWQTSSGSSSSSSSSSSEDTAPAEVKRISKSKSKFTLDKDKATADGKDAVTVTVGLRTSSDEPVSSSKLIVEATGSANTVSEAKKEGDDYKITLNSTKAEQKEIKIKVGSWELGSLQATFEPGPYSRSHSLMMSNKWVAKTGEEAELELKVRDEFDNELGNDKKPAAEWKIVQEEGAGQIVEPSLENGWKAKVVSNQIGRSVFSANYNNEKLENKAIIYYNLELPNLHGLAAEKIHTFKKGEAIKLSGSSGEKIGIRLEDMSDASKVVVKISSTPQYVWLSKNAEGGKYEGTMVFSQEDGKHEILIYSENEKGETNEFAKGSLKITRSDVKKERSNWIYYLIGLGSLMALGLAVVLAVPKLRMRLLGLLKIRFLDKPS